MTIHEPIRINGNVIEYYGEPVGIFTGDNWKRDEFEGVTLDFFTPEEYDDIQVKSYSEGEAAGYNEAKGELKGSIENLFNNLEGESFDKLYADIMEAIDDL